jgi:hypothetical protein
VTKVNAIEEILHFYESKCSYKGQKITTKKKYLKFRHNNDMLCLGYTNPNNMKDWVCVQEKGRRKKEKYEKWLIRKM